MSNCTCGKYDIIHLCSSDICVCPEDIKIHNYTCPMTRKCIHCGTRLRFFTEHSDNCYIKEYIYNIFRDVGLIISDYI